MNIWNFYLEGFRSMTLGRTLWIIIIVKLFIMFFILKIFFFPNYLGHLSTDKEKSEYVGDELIRLFLLRIERLCHFCTFPTDF